MKKVLLSLFVVFLAVNVYAQKQTQTVTRTTAHTETRYQNTQARMPQLLVQPLVMPLVGEVDILKNVEHKFKLPLTKSKVEQELDGNLENVQNYGIYMWTDAANCDMIVGATFNFYTNDANDGYVLEIKGFPANFKNWRSATTNDYEWMRITGAQGAGNRAVQPTVKY